MPFAGHPTVGAAALRRPSARAPDAVPPRICAWCWKSGSATSSASPAIAAARRSRRPSPCPVCRRRAGRAPSADEIAARLGLAPDDIGFGAHRPVVYGAGVDFVFAPLASAEALARADPDAGRWGADNGPAIYCYTPGGDGVDYRARMFASGWGIREDPATGSAAAAFAGIVMRFARPATANGLSSSTKASRWVGRAASRSASKSSAARSKVGDDRRLGGARRRGNARPVSASRILSIDALDLAFAARPWPFAET